MRSHLFLFGIILGSLLALPATAWTTEISVTSGDYTIPLVIGMSDAATNDYDPGQDIPLPPPFPGATFNAYLAGTSLFPMLQTDVRETPEWRLHVDADESILIAWKAAPILLMITIDGKRYPMDTSGDATLPPGSYRILIEPFNEQEVLLPEPITEDFLQNDGEDILPYQASESPFSGGKSSSEDLVKTPEESSFLKSESSTPVPAPAESGISFIPMLGGLIVAFCALCFCHKRRDQ